MLTFISFWRAAAVVLNDLGSSAFYAGGIAEEAVGKSAPWFILGVMLFSFAVRAVYVESCSMFTRGGVYRVVKEALGGTFAKLSVSPNSGHASTTTKTTLNLSMGATFEASPSDSARK